MKQPLIPDIKPEVKRDRSRMGVVEIALDQGTRVKCVGMVYGMEHTVREKGYEVQVFLDHYSQRVKVSDYHFEPGHSLISWQRCVGWRMQMGSTRLSSWPIKKIGSIFSNTVMF